MLLGCLLFNMKGSAQTNLVPNPSFEELDSCWTIGSFSETGIIDWYNPGGGTSDMFNACHIDGLGVPVNLLGWQEARTGVGYAGLGVYEDLFIDSQTGWFEDVREYIQVELSEPLIENGEYRLSCFVSLADKFSSCATSGLGMYISSEQISSDIPFELFDFQSQVYFMETILDSINWVELSGLFVAEGNEKYLTIGGFSHDSDMEISCFSDTVFHRVSYYYVDDVS